MCYFLWFASQILKKLKKKWKNCKGPWTRNQWFWSPSQILPLLCLPGLNLFIYNQTGMNVQVRMCSQSSWRMSFGSFKAGFHYKSEWHWHLDLFNYIINTCLNCMSKFLQNRSIKHIVMCVHVLSFFFLLNTEEPVKYQWKESNSVTHTEKKSKLPKF